MSVHYSVVSRGVSATGATAMLQIGDSINHPSVGVFPYKLPHNNCSCAAMEPSALVHGSSKCVCLYHIHWSVDIGEQFSFSRTHGSCNRAKPQLLQFLQSSGTSMWGCDLVICIRKAIPTASVLGVAVCCVSLNLHVWLVIFASSFIK